MVGTKLDDHYSLALSVAMESDYVSIPMLQRKLYIGYNLAYKIIERLEVNGIIGSGDGKSSTRKVLEPITVTREEESEGK